MRSFRLHGHLADFLFSFGVMGGILGLGLNLWGTYQMETTEKLYTYEDYYKIDDDKRREIINGVIYAMSPGASTRHQEISGSLFREISFYLKWKKCKVYHPPYDVCLPRAGETRRTATNVVQPDIFVVCDRRKIKLWGCFGAPDLVMEILSPSTKKRDMLEKFNLYQEHGVLEYWVVDPFNQSIDRFVLDIETGKYGSAQTFFPDDNITPTIFPDFTIKLSEVFPPIDEYDYDDDEEEE